MLTNKMKTALFVLLKQANQAIESDDLSMYCLGQMQNVVDLLDREQDKQAKEGQEITIIGGNK